MHTWTNLARYAVLPMALGFLAGPAGAEENPAEAERAAAEAARQDEREAERLEREAERRLDRAVQEIERLALEMHRRELEGGEISPEDKARIAELRNEVARAAREIALFATRTAAPIVADVMRELRVTTERRAMLGVNVSRAEGELADEGVFVEAVTPGWPADEAGIRSGDVIVAFGGSPLATDERSPQSELVRLLREADPGQKVTVTVVRGGQERDIEVTTTSSADWSSAYAYGFSDENGMRWIEGAPRPPNPPEPFLFMRRWGDMELVELSAELGQYFGTEEGLLVVRAPADEALGLRDGDVILEIDGRKPQNPGHAMRILRSYTGGETMTLDILRERERRELEVELPAEDGPVPSSGLLPGLRTLPST